MNLDKKALAGFIKEIEDSRTRQKAETEFQRDVFKRARDKNFDVKAMRIVLQRRAMEPGKRDEQDYNVHAYELALGAKKDAVEDMERGMSAREAAAKHGLPRAAVTALKPGAENANFEPRETAVSDQPGDDTRTPEPSRSAEVVANPSSGGVEGHATSPEGSKPTSDADLLARGANPTAGVEPGPLDTHSDDATYREAVTAIWTTPEDDLAFPPGLDRRRRAA